MLLDGEVVTVDDEFLAGETRARYAGQDAGVLWPLVLEKALAMRYGGGYDDIDGDSAGRAMGVFGYDPDYDVMNPTFSRDPDDEDVADTMSDALDAGLPVTARGDGSIGMGGRHMWTVMAVEEVDGTTMVTVRNPWGSPGMRLEDGEWVYGDGEPVDFARDEDGDLLSVHPDDPDLLVMPIDMFTANYDGIHRATGLEG